MRISRSLNLLSTCTVAALAALALVLAGSFAAFREARNGQVLAVRIRVDSFERSAFMDHYFLRREARDKALWDQSRARAEDLLRQAGRQFKGEGDPQILAHLQRSLEESAAIFRRIADNTPALGVPGRSRPVFEELDKRLSSQLLLKTGAVRDLATALQDAAEERMQKAYQRLTLIIGVFALGLALVIFLTSMHFGRLIRRRLGPLHAGVRIVAGGDLDYRLETDGRDEFSDLGQSINAMTEKLQAFTRQLEEAFNARKLSEILDQVDACIYIKDPQGRYVFANRTMREWFGATMEEIAGQGDERFHEAGALERLRANDRLVLDEGRTVKAEETFFNRMEQRTTTTWSVKHPLRNEAGEIYALCGVSTDLTDRKRLEAQLHQSQKLESLGSLAGGVAHDMNNVLGAILGLASAHLEIQPPGSGARRAFETITLAAQRGGRLVRSLLTFARQSPAENLQVDLNAILCEEALILERTTLSRIRLEMDLAPDLHPVRGDAGALSHAIMNLCVNAVDAMEGAGTLALRTRNLEGRQVEVTVEDQGTGMSREVLEKAMDPFFTTKEQGKGTGLGLAMVYSTLRAHHGEVELESEVGRGTRVRLILPADGTAAPAPPPLPADPPSPSRSKRHVLLVDDDDLVQRATQEVLEGLGHSHTSARSGEEALAALEGGLHPDVVILDLNMPGLGGAGTLPRLRALRPDLAVLLSTGRTDQTALDLVRTHPRVTLLPKPFTLAELQEQLSRTGPP